MAHVMKLTRAAIGHMFKHYERAKDENGDYVKFGNTEIDTKKSESNYNLAPKRKSQGDFLKQRCQEVYCFNRKDVNVACSWIVTIPKDFQEQNPERTQEDFFQSVYEFLEQRYGEENVISSYVHLDETTPHMHFVFVPVVSDKKRGRKVSAKECITKRELQIFHTDLQEYLDRNSLSCGVLNEATREGNKSVKELKQGTANEKLEDLKNELQDTSVRLSHAKTELKRLSMQKNLLQGQMDDLKSELRDARTELKHNLLSLKELEEIHPKKTITGALKGITVEEIMKLKKTARFVERVFEIQKEIEKEKQIIRKKQEEVKKVPIQEQLEKHKLQLENKNLKDRIDLWNETLEQCPDEIRSHFLNVHKNLKESYKQKEKGFER